MACSRVTFTFIFITLVEQDCTDSVNDSEEGVCTNAAKVLSVQEVLGSHEVNVNVKTNLLSG